MIPNRYHSILCPAGQVLEAYAYQLATYRKKKALGTLVSSKNITTDIGVYNSAG